MYHSAFGCWAVCYALDFEEKCHLPVKTQTDSPLQESKKNAMFFLIQTSQHPRPYLSTISFIANDFAAWGFRVSVHAEHSPYIHEIRYRELEQRPGVQRMHLIAIWIAEALRRGNQQSEYTFERTEDTLATRQARASTFTQEFFRAIGLFSGFVLGFFV